jgi:hypothetical protein
MSTKKPRTIVPPPQSARIMQRYVAGDSIRQIARGERRDRATVTKIVRSDEMSAVVQKMRERYYGLGLDALDAVQHGLQVRKDGGLGRQVLTDIGVIPSSGERYAITSQPNKAMLTQLGPVACQRAAGTGTNVPNARKQSFRYQDRRVRAQPGGGCTVRESSSYRDCSGTRGVLSH